MNILRGKEKSAKESCREVDISAAVYYHWKRQYGGMDVDQTKRLKALGKENNRLKKLLAEKCY